MSVTPVPLVPFALFPAAAPAAAAAAGESQRASVVPPQCQGEEFEEAIARERAFQAEKGKFSPEAQAAVDATFFVGAEAQYDDPDAPEQLLAQRCSRALARLLPRTKALHTKLRNAKNPAHQAEIRAELKRIQFDISKLCCWAHANGLLPPCVGAAWGQNEDNDAALQSKGLEALLALLIAEIQAKGVPKEPEETRRMAGKLEERLRQQMFRPFYKAYVENYLHGGSKLHEWVKLKVNEFRSRHPKRRKTSEGATAAGDGKTPAPLSRVLRDTRASAYQLYDEKPEGCVESGAAVIIATPDGKIRMFQGDRVPLKPECAMIDPQHPVRVDGKNIAAFIHQLDECHATYRQYAPYFFPHIMLREKAKGTQRERLNKLLREELQQKLLCEELPPQSGEAKEVQPAGYLQRGNSARCLPLFILFTNQLAPHAEAQRKHGQVQGVFTPKSIVVDRAVADVVDVSNTELFTPDGDHYKLKSDYHEVRKGTLVSVEEVPARLERYARRVHAACAQHPDFSLQWWGDNAFLQPEIWNRVVGYIHTHKHASAQ
jgi:hypothetical protein